MEVLRWISYTEASSYLVKYGSVGNEKDVIIADIIANRYYFDGEYHQYGKYGVPVLAYSNGVVQPATYTWRAWGAIMAEAWNKIENADKYTYLDFYMGSKESLKFKTPETPRYEDL